MRQVFYYDKPKSHSPNEWHSNTHSWNIKYMSERMQHLINPNIFKRINYNDCLVNGGKTLANGAIISFKYANTFSYPLSVSSVRCKWSYVMLHICGFCKILWHVLHLVPVIRRKNNFTPSTQCSYLFLWIFKCFSMYAIVRY